MPESVLNDPELQKAVKAGDFNKIQTFKDRLTPQERDTVKRTVDHYHPLSEVPAEQPSLAKRAWEFTKEEGPGLLKRIGPPLAGQLVGSLAGPLGAVAVGALGGGLGEAWAEKGEIEAGKRPDISYPQIALQAGLSALPGVPIAKSISLPLRMGIRALEGTGLGAGATALSSLAEGQAPTWESVGRGGLMGLGMGTLGGGVSEIARPSLHYIPMKEKGIEASQILRQHGIEAPLAPSQSITATGPRRIENFLKERSAMEGVGYKEAEAGRKAGELIQEKVGGLPTSESEAAYKAAYVKSDALMSNATFVPETFKAKVDQLKKVSGMRIRKDDIASQYIDKLHQRLNPEPGLILSSELIMQASKGETSLPQLVEWRKEIGDEIERAENAGENYSAKKLMGLKKSIDSEFDSLAEGKYGGIDPQAAQSLKEANALYHAHSKKEFVNHLLTGRKTGEEDFDIFGGTALRPQANNFYKRLFKIPKVERIERLSPEGNQIAEALAYYMPNVSELVTETEKGKVSKIGLGGRKIIGVGVAKMIGKIYNNPEMQSAIIKSYKKGIGVSNKLLDTILRQSIIKSSEQEALQ